jgi:hypothetical protein
MTDVWPRIAIALLLLSEGACKKDDREAVRRPDMLVELQLRGLDGVPEMHIAVPAFGAPSSRFEGAYYLSGGSVGEGFMTTIFVGRHPEHRPRESCASASCRDEQITDAGGRRTQRCTEDRVDDSGARVTGVDVHVALSVGGTPICCSARWTAYTALTDTQRRIADGIETSCSTLR